MAEGTISILVFWVCWLVENIYRSYHTKYNDNKQHGWQQTRGFTQTIIAIKKLIVTWRKFWVIPNHKPQTTSQCYQEIMIGSPAHNIRLLLWTISYRDLHNRFSSVFHLSYNSSWWWPGQRGQKMKVWVEYQNTWYLWGELLLSST